MNTVTETGDRSNTLFNEAIGEHYHSKHGALQESRHVFIDAGLKRALTGKQEINLLEVGFGTGLNFILTLQHCFENNVRLNYTALEAFPLSLDTIRMLGYHEHVSSLVWEQFTKSYNTALTTQVPVSENAALEVAENKLQNYTTSKKFDLVYYDAFSVRHQPEMWTAELISKTCDMLLPGGIFVTYAITGDLKRAVKSAGFEIEKLPGAPGKREMLRATKL